jgi:hypothetical protein
MQGFYMVLAPRTSIVTRIKMHMIALLWYVTEVDLRV